MLPNILRCFLLLIIGLRIIWGSPEPYKSHYSVRRTKADEILKYMNTTVDPCDDFYEYNCANFGKYHEDLLPTMKNVIILGLMNTEMGRKIKLELQADNVNDRVSDRKVKEFYRSCLKQATVTDTYLRQLREQIREFGKMPVLEGDNWRESDFDWVSTVADMSYKMNVGTIFNIEVVPDFVDKTVKRAMISEPVLYLKQKAQYVNENFKDNLQEYKHLVFQRLHIFLQVDEQLALQTANEIVNFEIDLAHGLLDPQTTTSVADVITLTDTEELQRKYLPLLDTKKLINSSLGYLSSQVLTELPYLENAFSVIKKTPKRVLANYIFFTYITKFIKNFPDDVAEQEDHCLKVTKEYFIKNLENMMFRKYFTEHDKQRLNTMWDEFKATFVEVLRSPRVSWMREQTRREALAKMRTIKFEINAYENEDFDRHLSPINMYEFDYVHNIHSVLILKGNVARAKINQPPVPETDPLLLSTTPAYLPQENAVKIPVYFLQPYRLFSSSYPVAFNYAGVGFLIAHELIHGFDDSGSSYDANGNLRNWWDPQSTRAFQDRTRCLKDQYKKYTVGGYPVPELKVQSENIADNGAIHLAYYAYLKWYERASKLTQKMEWFPGMEYTPKKLFFVSFAQSWCSHTDPSYIPLMLQADTHAPQNLRVIVPLSNFEEFSREFNCPQGSGMNPIHKCVIY